MEVEYVIYKYKWLLFEVKSMLGYIFEDIKDVTKRILLKVGQKDAR